MFELTIIVANERFTTTHDARRLDGQLGCEISRRHAADDLADKAIAHSKVTSLGERSL